MALTLPIGSMVDFKTGTIDAYKNAIKTDKTIYLVNDNNKFYLYSGANEIYSKIDIATDVSQGNQLPVTSDTVYNYTLSAFEVINGTTKGITDADMIPGRFYYYNDGTLKFKYNFDAPLKLGIKSVTDLPIAGQGETEQIYCLTTKNTSGAGTTLGLYYYPSASSSAVKIATGDGFLLTSPANGQTIEKDLTLSSGDLTLTTGDLTLSSGNLTLTAGKVLTVDTIQKASTGTNDKITLNGNSAVNGTLSVSSSLTASDITATNITANTLLKTINLTVDGIINNGTIFSTVKAVEGGAAAQIKLEAATEFYFGTVYYLKPGSINLPGGTITGDLTLSSSDLTLSSGDLTLSSGTITGTNINITDGFISEVNNGKKWVRMKAGLAFNPKYTYYINTIGEGHLNSLSTSGEISAGSTLISSGKATLNSLEVTTSTLLKSSLNVDGEATLSNKITTNYFNCTLDSNNAADKMTMIKPLYFGTNYYIDTAGVAKLTSFEVGSGIISGSLKVLGNLALTKIDSAYEFIGKTISAVAEGAAGNQSGSTVTGVTARLTYAGQQVLTKADLTATNGLIKSITDGISTTVSTLNTTVTNNKTATDAMIVIANAGTNGAAPAAVTANTKIWIDTAEGNGVIKIKTTGGTWVPVSSVWT